MLSISGREFCEAFAVERDDLLAMLLRLTAEQAGSTRTAVHSALSDFSTKILPGFGKYRIETHGCSQIFAHESAKWEYRFYDYGTEEKGAPTISKERPYALPGVALIPAPQDEYTSSGWELYWLSDGTLLSAARKAEQYSNAANQSSSLESLTNWIERTFTLFSLNEMASLVSVPQLCTLLAQMLSHWQHLSKRDGVA